MLGEGSRTGPDGRRRTVVSTGRRASIVDRPIVRGFHKVGITTAATVAATTTPGTIYTGTKCGGGGGTVATIITTAIAIGFWRKRSIVLLLLLRGHRRHHRRRRRRRRWRRKAHTGGEAIWHLHRRSVGPRGGRTGRDSDHVVQNVLPGVLEVPELRLDLDVHVGRAELFWGRRRRGKRNLVLW